MPGTERSHLDPPIRSAVRMITDSAYPRNEREKNRRRLRTDDHLNVAELNFVEGELVFIDHANVQENDYKLPLSVAKVKKVMRNHPVLFLLQSCCCFVLWACSLESGCGRQKNEYPSARSFTFFFVSHTRFLAMAPKLMFTTCVASVGRGPGVLGSFHAKKEATRSWAPSDIGLTASVSRE